MKIFELVILKLKSLLPESVKAILRQVPIRIKMALLSVTYLLNLPSITAFLWVLYSKKVANAAIKSNGTLMVFDSPGGLDDIKAAFNGNTFEFKVISIDGEFIKHLFAYFFGKNFCDYDFKSEAESRVTESEKYRAYLSEMTLYFKKYIHLRAYINFNFVYHAQRELMKVASANGVKFITMMKECLRTEGYYDGTVSVYQTRIGEVSPSAILVHNTQTRDLVLESGIYPKGILEVVGQGRSDRLFRFRESAPQDSKKHNLAVKKILYFAISETAGLPYFGFGSSFAKRDAVNFGVDFNWSKLAEDTLNALIEYVSFNENIELIVKGKPTGVYDLKRINNPRVTYMHGNPDINLLESIDVVVGFNTTGLFEAVAAGIPTVSSELGVIRDEKSTRFLYNFEGVVKIAENKIALFDSITKALCGERFATDTTTRDQLLDKYLGNYNGNSGMRIKTALLQHINN